MPSLVDPLRLLAQRSEVGYTDRQDLAMPDEPEAVPVDYQQRITRDAHARPRDTFVDARETMRDALKTLDGNGFAAIAADVRLILRTIERMNRKLAA